jgi:GTP-binding protein LepA
LQALIFDSHYDAYRGVIIHFRIFEGLMREGQDIKFMHGGSTYKIEELGIFQLGLVKKSELRYGDVGYCIAGIKTISDVGVGDTITSAVKGAKKPLPGFKEVKPVVFSSIYPVDTNDYEELVNSIERLKLNDASLIYEKDSSAALGFGFRCGFLGMLHLEVVQERIEREFDLSIVFTSPSVKYIVHLKNGEVKHIDNPLSYPDPMQVDFAEEPYIKASVITPTTYVGPIINLCMEKRGTQKEMNYLDEKRVELIYDMPLAEVLFDFYDRLKSISRGYASFDYEVQDYKRTDLVRLDILVNGEPVDALSQLVFRGNSQSRGRQVCNRLRGEIPRQQFKIAIQATIGGTIVSRETITAFRKDVTAKCYGGDISRKRKLLEKQKEGKKRMKMVGNVEIPQSAFLAVLKSDEASS